jgi:hypothetical protein
MVSTGATRCERISFIASYVSRHLGGTASTGWSVFKVCGMGFSLRGELGCFVFVFGFDLSKLNDGWRV